MAIFKSFRMATLIGLVIFNYLLTPASAITCLKVGQTATATFNNADGQRCTWTGVVGSNFGINDDTFASYDCQGRCGAGCTGISLGNAYTQNCFSHDVCSYFYSASGGSDDPNCGEAFDAAKPDFAGGLLFGCGQDNPDPPKLPLPPGNAPVCQ